MAGGVGRRMAASRSCETVRSALDALRLLTKFAEHPFTCTSGCASTLCGCACIGEPGHLSSAAHSCWETAMPYLRTQIKEKLAFIQNCVQSVCDAFTLHSWLRLCESAVLATLVRRSSRRPLRVLTPSSALSVCNCTRIKNCWGHRLQLWQRGAPSSSILLPHPTPGLQPCSVASRSTQCENDREGVISAKSGAGCG